MIVITRGRWGDKTFADDAEFREYLQETQALYAPLRQHMGQSQSAFQQLDQALSQLLNAPSNPQQLQWAINSASAAHQTNGGLPPIDTEDANLIKSFISVSVELAAKVASQLSSPPNPTTEHQAALIVTAYRYPRLVGHKGWSFAQATAPKISAFESELSKAEHARKKFTEESEKLLDASRKTFESEILKQDDAAKDQRGAIQVTWEELKDTYDAKLALQAPRTYWERQRESHARGAVAAKSQFRQLGIGATLFATIILISIWSATASKSADVPIALWLISGAILGVAFWVIRLFSRIYLSREHLARDAEERVTMIETYLALIQHGRVKDDDLKFVLASIFRPTEDGLVKDDTLPSPLLDLFQQARGK